MADRRKCKFKQGRRCFYADMVVTKDDCVECSYYSEEEEARETVLEHLGKMDCASAAAIICAKVEEYHGWPDRLSLWLRKTWEERDGKA